MAQDAKTKQPIFHGSTKVGLRNVGSYQVAGQPFITGSGGDSPMWTGKEVKVEFPYVTKKILVVLSGTVSNDSHLRVHFASTGSSSRVILGNHYFPLDSHEDSGEIAAKCKEIYISSPSGSGGEFWLYAELTNIPTSSMYTLTGAGIDQ